MSGFDFGYREVIPDQTLLEKWKEITLNTGGTQSILQDVKVAERAGGYCYIDSSKYYTRNRFIYWRIYHDILELAEHSLDVNLNDSRVRYRFTDTPILDGISIHEFTGKVIILIPTVCSVHCLSFTHPDRIHKQEMYGSHPDLTVPSIFADANALQIKDPSTFHIINNINSTLPHAAASILNRSQQEATFILAYSNNTLMLIRMVLNSTHCSVVELKQESIVPRFLSGIAGAFRGGKNADGQVAVSLLLHCIGSECFAFVLGRDGHLRVWNCNEGHCINSLDVLMDTGAAQSSLTQGSQNHIIRKSTDSYNQKLTIGIFLCFTNACQFQIFTSDFEHTSFVFSRITTKYAPEHDLVDFSLDTERIWVVWRNQTECSVTSSYINRAGEASWMPAVLEPTPPRDYIPNDDSIDPRQAYSEYIFYPGRFPIQVITRALSIYRKSALLTDSSISPVLLKQRVCIAIEEEIRAEVLEYELSDDDYLEIANRCWARFYSCCAQYNATGARPLGILLLPPVAGIVLLRKASLSLLRPMDVLEHLALCGPQTTSEQLLQTSLISNDVNIGKDLLQLMSLMVSIEEYLSDDMKAHIERELRCLRPPNEVISDLVRVLNFWEFCPKASSITNLYNVMLLLLQNLRLDKFHNLENQKSSPNQKISTIDHLYSSAFGVSVVTETIRQMAVIRFSICRNLLLLQHMLFEGRQQDWTVLESVRSNCMPDTFLFAQGYFTIVWLCESVVSPVTLLESHQQRLSSLQLTPVVTSARLTSNHRQTTLPELFILGGGGKKAHQQLIQLNPDLNMLPLWHNSLLVYTNILAKLIWPINGTLILGEWLLASGQHLVLQQYVRQLSPWCEWNNCSRQFLLAVAFLANGERHKAFNLFQFATNAIHTEKFLHDKILTNTNTPTTIGALTENQALTEYYLKVIHLFEQYDAYDCAIQMAEIAISRAEENDPHLPTLHSIIFVHYLNLEHYEQAYHALEVNPDQDRRKDCLRLLVGTLLEKRELECLIKFPYVGAMSAFEKIVESRARAMNLQDNYIYDFLYSFHVAKGNFKRAASIMYEQGLFLSQINQEWALERQVKSYLTCLNCLHLVKKQHRLIVRPRAFVDEQPVVETADLVEIPGRGPLKIVLTDEIRHRMAEEGIKLDEHFGEDLANIDLKRDIEVLGMEDIKKELAHVTARLKLTKLSPHSQISCYSTPAELVGLLLNVGLFDVAADLSTTFHLTYEPVFEALTTPCLRKSHQSNMIQSWLFENHINDISLSETNPKNASWLLLQHMLEKYEQDGLTTLHKVVCRRVISFGGFLPHWLTESYKKRNPGELIRLYNSFGRLREAYELSVDLVEAALGKGPEYFGFTHTVAPGAEVFHAKVPFVMPLCLPIVTLLETLKRLGKVGSSNEKYKEYFKQLAGLLQTYGKNAQRVSNKLEELQWARKKIYS